MQKQFCSSFQQIQGLSALQSSIRYFAQIVIGTSTNVALVYLMPRIKVLTLTMVSACITLVSPAIMATVSMNASYWTGGPFWALLLCPVNPWGKRHAPQTGSVLILFLLPHLLI